MSTLATEKETADPGDCIVPSPVQPIPQSPLSLIKPPPRPQRGGMRWFGLLLLAAVLGSGIWLAMAWPRIDTAAIVGQATPPAESSRPTSKASLGFLSEDKKGGATAPCETVMAEIVDRSDTLRLTGTLIADEKANVASNTSGIAAEVLVDRGSLVRKNDVLVQIDPTDAKQKLAEGTAMFNELKARLGLDGDMSTFNPEDQPEVRLAKASADLAEANFRRAKETYAKKVISTESYDQSKTEHELAVQRYRQALLLIKQAYQACLTAQAKLAILQKAVTDTTIRAPFDGWVAEKSVAVGEQISSGMQATTVVTLVRIDPLRLSLTVPQQNMGSIQPGQIVRFHVDSFPDRTFEAIVRFIAPVVTKDTRSMFVEAIVPNSEHALRPGLFATAELELKNKARAVYVPVGAVLRADDVARVFVVCDGVARQQVVALGDIGKEKIEIRAGLTGKETLVTRPERVRDGDPVHAGAPVPAETTVPDGDVVRQ